MSIRLFCFKSIYDSKKKSIVHPRERNPGFRSHWMIRRWANHASVVVAGCGWLRDAVAGGDSSLVEIAVVVAVVVAAAGVVGVVGTWSRLQQNEKRLQTNAN